VLFASSAKYVGVLVLRVVMLADDPLPVEVVENLRKKDLRLNKDQTSFAGHMEDRPSLSDVTRRVWERVGESMSVAAKEQLRHDLDLAESVLKQERHVLSVPSVFEEERVVVSVAVLFVAWERVKQGEKDLFPDGRNDLDYSALSGSRFEDLQSILNDKRWWAKKKLFKGKELHVQRGNEEATPHEFLMHEVLVGDPKHKDAHLIPSATESARLADQLHDMDLNTEFAEKAEAAAMPGLREYLRSIPSLPQLQQLFHRNDPAQMEIFLHKPFINNVLRCVPPRPFLFLWPSPSLWTGNQRDFRKLLVVGHHQTEIGYLADRLHALGLNVLVLGKDHLLGDAAGGHSVRSYLALLGHLDEELVRIGKLIAEAQRDVEQRAAPLFGEHKKRRSTPFSRSCLEDLWDLFNDFEGLKNLIRQVMMQHLFTLETSCARTLDVALDLVSGGQTSCSSSTGTCPTRSS